MYDGEIKFFHSDKGYGFIKTDADPVDDDQDVFVHYTDCRMTGFVDFEEGDPVRFELVEGDEGPKAEEVRKVG